MTEEPREPTPLSEALRPLTMKQLAELCGVSYSMMQKVALGTRRPNDLIKEGLARQGIDWRDVFPEAAEGE